MTGLTCALCVMPLENAGDYKTVLILAQAPSPNPPPLRN
jgi:hypothetical protein